MEPAAYVESLRPAGSKRSSKRDLIVNVFLRQEGHLTADDLFDLTRREDASLRPARPLPAPRNGSAAPRCTAPCNGWSRPASRARLISARGVSDSSTPTGIL